MSGNPVETVTIPVRPLAGTVANVAALVAAGVVAGGTTAMVAAATALTATGMAVKGGKKAVAARARRAAAPGRPSRAARGAVRGRSRGKAVGTGGGAAAKRMGKTAAKATPSTTVSGRRPVATTKGTPAPSTARASRGRVYQGGTLTTGGKKSGAARSVSRRARAIANSPARKWAAARTAAAWKGTKTAAKRATRATRSSRRRAWRGLRKWFQRRIMGRRPAVKTQTRPLATRVDGDLKAAFVRGILNGPITGTTQPARIIPPLAGGTITVPPTASSGGIMKDIARQMVAYAEEYDAPGVLEIVDDLDNNLEGALVHVADAYKILSEKSRARWPFDDAIIQKLSMIGECLDTAAQMARGVVPDIETIHEAELRRLRNPGVGQEKFDLSANGMV